MQCCLWTAVNPWRVHGMQSCTPEHYQLQRKLGHQYTISNGQLLDLISNHCPSPNSCQQTVYALKKEIACETWNVHSFATNPGHTTEPGNSIRVPSALKQDFCAVYSTFNDTELNLRLKASMYASICPVMIMLAVQRKEFLSVLSKPVVVCQCMVWRVHRCSHHTWDWFHSF